MVFLTIAAGFRYMTMSNAPQAIWAHPKILEEGQRLLSSEGYSCSALKSIKKCTFKHIEYTFLSCGPNDGTDKVYADGVYYNKFDTAAPIPTFEQSKAAHDKLYRPYKGTLDKCPTDL